MFEKIKLTEQKYEDISQKLTDLEVINDNKLYASLMKEYKNLTPVVEKYREYCNCQKTMENARQLLDEAGTDRKMKELAILLAAAVESFLLSSVFSFRRIAFAVLIASSSSIRSPAKLVFSFLANSGYRLRIL